MITFSGLQLNAVRYRVTLEDTDTLYIEFRDSDVVESLVAADRYSSRVRKSGRSMAFVGPTYAQTPGLTPPGTGTLLRVHDDKIIAACSRASPLVVTS